MSQEQEQTIQTNWFETIQTFDQLPNIKEDLLRGIYAYGFEKPSKIQQVSILPVFKNKDTIAQSQSGTGKTGAFSIGVLQQIDNLSPNVQALILAPTRELAIQNSNVIKAIGEKMGAKVHCCTGGTDYKEDIKQLQQGIQVIVGTPGRVFDLIERGKFQTSHLKIFVLDEADEMLGRGFKDTIKDIFRTLPPEIQVALFSATMPMEIINISQSFMRDPATILVKNEEVTLDGIKQYYIALEDEKWKDETMIEIFKNVEIQQCIVYCKTQQRVEDLTKVIEESDFEVLSIHGKSPQEERMKIMNDFRQGKSRILITTDLLQRGIDIQQISLVINYDLPQQKESYIHRIGRSGRYGKKGVAINMVTPGDVAFIQDIEEFYSTKIQELPFDLGKIFD